MPVPCARCAMPLPKWDLVRGATSDCPSCGSENHVRLYAAAVSRAPGPGAESALDGEAACFDHPAKRAVAVCGQCGRFVCGLCAIGSGTGVLCPSCVVNPAGKRRAGGAKDSRMLWDTWALSVPFALLIFWPATILSAPAVIALSIMKWKQPISPVRRNRWRFVAGLAVSLIQGGLWVWLGWYLVAKIRSGA